MKIYLAIPYSHPDPKIREARFREANRMAAILLNDGHIVFSPISHSHPIACQCELPKGYPFWRRQAHSFIDWCDEVWIICLPGWTKSEGIRAEIKYAKQIEKPVKKLNITYGDRG